MAKKKGDKKEKPPEKKTGKETPKKATRNVQGTIFTIAILVLAVVFLPSSLLLLIGMMPSLTAVFVDPAHARTKVVTVGVMNLAGCVPFLLDLWTQSHSIDQALSIVADPMAIIVMYSAAAIGYLLDWLLSTMVAGILYQRGQARVVAIRKRQEELVARWGVEVTGQLALDQHGFASESDIKEHKQG